MVVVEAARRMLGERALAAGGQPIDGESNLVEAVGPLIEVPILVALVYVALRVRNATSSLPPLSNPQGPRSSRDLMSTEAIRRPSVLFVCVHSAGDGIKSRIEGSSLSSPRRQVAGTGALP
ncbi:hypothetical protein QFZ79_003636 [Arthrobacter sp. V4I6]|uniref:hypothetical protein n=1 Tax=unclassified Arthrobacter TaxID=235627 RepID=UPI0027828D54|nr:MULTISPECIES: hypothetical protein [unclassified Arthrobacter]MDQ0821262.1 hypothetical protein [Arthrobacter sp. V1I7]MDQ0855525.1 hypothetical protein [Arthrobacter sp. V4I6]